MRKNIIIFILCIFLLCGCNEKTFDDESCIDIMRDALLKTYESNEIINSSNIQKNMEGNWVIVEAPSNLKRSFVPQYLDESTKDIEWDAMYITVCNTESHICKDLKLFRNTSNELYVGSESEAVVSHE